MQKKLIALAIAGLGFTGAAFAQSNVTIYGVVDASVDFTNVGDGPAGSGERATKISSNSSRIGFKGSEDLGDGLKAVFQLETAFNADGDNSAATAATPAHTAANLNSRNTFVGLASDSWGRVILGIYDTPYKTSTRSWDVFADHLADNRNLMGGVAGKTSAYQFDGRPLNTIRYDNKWNDFSLAAAYVAGAESTTVSATKGSAWSLSGAFDFTSEFSGIVAYEKHTIGSVGTGTLVPVAGVTAVAGNDEKAWKVGLGYKSGPIRAGLVYEKTSDDFATSLGHKAWTVDGGYTFAGNNEFKLAYTKANDLDGVGSSGAKQWAVGLDHILSKRTKVYAEYVKLSNDAKASYGLTGAGGNNTAGVTAAAVDADPSAWQFGMRHSF